MEQQNGQRISKKEQTRGLHRQVGRTGRGQRKGRQSREITVGSYRPNRGKDVEKRQNRKRIQ